MQGRVMSLKGKAGKKLDLPELFEELYRPDLIKKAVVVSQTNRKQAYGRSPRRALRPQRNRGDRGGSRTVPRLKNSSPGCEGATSRWRKKSTSAELEEGIFREVKQERKAESDAIRDRSHRKT